MVNGKEGGHMEKIAIISDIHGNMPALEAVLSDIKQRDISRIMCLGDLAGKGPESCEALDLIRSSCECVIKGNWDHYLAETIYDSPIIEWHQKVLGQDRLNYLNELPLYKEFYMSGKLVRLCHASPNDLFHRTYLFTEAEERNKLFEATPTLDEKADVVGYGDIHGAHVEFFSGKTIFNAGSVGNPLEITQASYAVLEGVYDSKETGPFSVSIVRVPYDIELAISRAQTSGMPDIDEYVNELRTGKYRGRKS